MRIEHFYIRLFRHSVMRPMGSDIYSYVEAIGYLVTRELGRS